MEEIGIISKKVEKDQSEILKIIEIYSEDSISFYEFVHDIIKTTLERKRYHFLNLFGKLHTQMVSLMLTKKTY